MKLCRLNIALPFLLGSFQPSRFFFLIQLLFLLPCFHNYCDGQTVLLRENFGTSTTFPAGWTPSSSAWQSSTATGSTGYAGASGGSNALYTGVLATSSTLTYNGLSTVGYENISVLWGARYSGLVAITVTLSWSTDGATWNDVPFINAAADATWALVNNGTRIPLPPGASGVQNLRLRLNAVVLLVGVNSNYRVDDFTVAGCAASSATISYAGTPYCRSITTAQPVTRTGTPGGTYSSGIGLTINSVTGEITPGTSTPGTYTVTYAIAASAGCSVQTTATSVTITAAPSANIIYAGSPFCSTSGPGLATLTGTAGGTFSSATGLSVNPVTGALNIASSSPGTYTVVYTIAPANGCGQYSTTASVTIVPSGTWTGAVNNDWNTAANWQCNSVPTSATNVVIPGNTSVFPSVIMGTAAVRNLTIQSGASLSLNGATLQIGGAITNNGSFTAANGTVEMNGTFTQVIPAGTFSGNILKSLVINNDAGVTLAGAMNLTDVLTVSKGRLTTGGYLVLKSSATANARVAPVTSLADTPVNGQVTVERFIAGQRKYRLITSAVTTSRSASLAAGQEGSSIWGNWQNAGNNDSSGTGTFITGGSSADGFDPQTSNASLFTYDDVRRMYVGYTTANGKNTRYTPLKAGQAYYMFIYGDRKNPIYTQSPNNTTLRSKGELTTGNQLYSTGSSVPLSGVTGNFTLLGNPFASSVNWATFTRTNLENTYWAWDPNLSATGGYVTVTVLGNVILQAPYSGVVGLNQYIQSGQGFFVRTAGPSPQLIIREQDKVPDFNPLAFRADQAAQNDLPLLAVNLQYQSGGARVLADGVVVAFDSTFSNTPGPEDAAKMMSGQESIAISNQHELLSIDARKMPGSADTLLLSLSGLSKPSYTLQIFMKKIENNRAQIYLQDKYLNTLQSLNYKDTNYIDFDVSIDNPASFDANRFRIVFQASMIALPVTYTSVRVSQKEMDALVEWEVAESGISRFEIERSATGSYFYKAGEVTATDDYSNVRYQWLDLHPFTGRSYYRLRGIKTNDQSVLSETVPANIDTRGWNIRVFPNPSKNKQLYLYSGNLEKGIYIVRLINQEGQQVYSFAVNHQGGKLNQPVYFKKPLPAGTYYLEIVNEKERNTYPVFIE